MPDNNRQKLYNYLKGNNMYKDSYDEFDKGVSTEEGRRKLYDYMVSKNAYKDSFDTFNSNLSMSNSTANTNNSNKNVINKDQKEETNAGATTTTAQKTTPKTGIQSPNNIAQVSDKDMSKTFDASAKIGASIGGILPQKTPEDVPSVMNEDGSVNEESLEENNTPVTKSQMQSLDAKLKFGSTADKYLSGNGAQLNVNTDLLDNGKPKFGSPEDFANTEKRQKMEEEERMQKQFAENPSPTQPEKSQFGSDMPWMQNEEQVSKEENERRSVIRQNIINYPYDHSVWDVTRAMQEEMPIRHYDFTQWADNGVSEKLDKLIAEENAKANKKYEAAVAERKKYGRGGYFGNKIEEERYFDAQKIIDNVSSVFMDNNGKDISDFVLDRIKIKTPYTSEDDTPKPLTEEEMQNAAKFNKHFAYEYGQVAKEIQQMLFDKLKAQNAPKDDLDYVMSSAFNNSLIGTISNTIIQKAAGSSGLRQQMKDMAMAEYGEDAGTLTNISAGIAPLALDVATGGFTIPSLAGSGVRNLATRIMVKNGVRKLSGQVAKEGMRLSAGAAGAVGRMMETDIAKNVVLNTLSSAANFGVYDLQREGVNQWKNNEFDPVGLAKSFGEGAVKGALLGTLGTTSKALTRNSSLGTKILTDAGAFAGEVGLFTGFDMASKAKESGLGISGIDINDVVSSAAQNAGVIAGMRLQGWITNPIKSLESARARYSRAKDFNINLNDDDWREIQNAGYSKDSFMKDMLGEDLNLVTEADDNGQLEKVVGIDYDMNGYKRLMNNTDIPLATRMKVAYIIEGVYPNSSPLNAVYGVVKTESDGITNISTVDENNNVVTSTDFKNTKDADAHEARMQDVVRFNNIYSLEGALNNFYERVNREKVGSKSVDELKEIATEGKDYTIDEILQKKDGITDEERQSLDMYTSLLYKNIQDGSEFVRSAQSMKDGSSAGRSADNHEQRRITGRSHEESSVNVDENVENGPDYRRNIDEMIDRGVSEESVARVITESGLTGEQKASLTEYATSKFAVNNVANQGEQAVSDMETPTPREEGEGAAGDAQKAGDFGMQYQKAVDALMASEGGEFAKRLSDGMLSSADVTDEMIYGWANTAYPKIAKQIIDYVNVYRKYQGMQEGIARKVNDAVDKEKARLEPILDTDDDGKSIFRQVEIDGATRDVVNFNDESQFIFYNDDDGQTKMVAKEKAGEVQTLSYDDYIGEYEKRMQSEIGDPTNWAFSHNVNTVKEIVPGTDENPGTVIQTPQGRLICVGQDELGNLLFRKAETDTATGKVKGVGEDIPMTKEQAWDLQDDLYDGRIVPTEEVKLTDEVKSTEEAKPTETPSTEGAVPTETTPTETPAVETPTEETGGMKFDDNGEPDFIGSGVDTTRGFLYDEKQSGITKEQADGYVDALIKEAEKALEKANKKTPKSTGFTKMKEELAAIQKEREDAQIALDHWKGVKAMNEKLSVESGVSVGKPVAATERYGIDDAYIGSEQDLKFKPTNDNGVVVDRFGNELVLYHGTTNTNLKLEDLERGHTRLNGESARFSGDGVSFTPDRTNAEEYADGGNVLECKVSLKNPFIIYGRPFGGGEDGDKAREFTKKLEEDGYDGILVYNSRHLADVVEVPIEVITFNKESIIGLKGNTIAETQVEAVQTQENTEQGQTKIPTVKQRNGGKDVYVKQYEEAEPYDTIQDMYATMEGQEVVDEFVREKLRTAKSQITKANSSGNQERIDRASKKLQYWQGIKSEIDVLVGKDNGITEREIAEIEDELYMNNLEYRIAKVFGVRSPFRINKKSFMKETGLSERDLEGDSKVYITSKGGITVDELAHKMFEDVHINPPVNGNAYESDERMFDSQEIKDALISVLSGSPIRFANELRNDVIKKKRDEEIRQYDDYAVQQGFANAEDMIAHDEVFLVQSIINDKYLDKTDFYNNFGEELSIPHNLEENEQRKSTDLTEGGVSETDSTESPETDRGRVERNDTEGAVEGAAGRNQVLRGTETDKGGGSAGGADQRAETTAGAEGNEQKGSVPTDSDIRKVERERVAKTAAEQADKEIEAKKAELQAARAELQRKNADIQKEYAKDNDLFGEGRKGEDAQLFETERDYSKDNINSILQKERYNVARIADELKALQEGRQKRIDDAVSAFDAQTTVYQQDGKGDENDSDAVRQNVISNVEAFINENFKGEEKDRLLEELNGYVKEQGNYDMLVGNGEYFHEVRQAFMDRWGGVRAWDDFVRTGKMPKRKRGGFRKEPKEGELLPPSDEKELQARFAEQNTLASNRLEVDKNNEYSKAIALANDALGAVSNLANLIKKAADTYNDWSNRKYKKNDTVVQVGEKYDDMDYTNMSIGAINEKRRQNVLMNARKDAEKYMGYIHTFLNKLGVPESEHEKYLPEGFKTFDELINIDKPIESHISRGNESNHNTEKPTEEEIKETVNDIDLWISDEPENRELREPDDNAESLEDYLRHADSLVYTKPIAYRSYIYQKYQGDVIVAYIYEKYNEVYSKDDAKRIAREIIEKDKFDFDDAEAIIGGFIKAKSDFILPFLDELAQIKKEMNNPLKRAIKMEEDRKSWKQKATEKAKADKEALEKVGIRSIDKLPKGVKWSDGKKYDSYSKPGVKAVVHNGNIYINTETISSKKGTYTVIEDFAKWKYSDLVNTLIDRQFMSASGNEADAILDIFHSNGLDIYVSGLRNAFDNRDSQQKTVAEKIEDVGEKIGGARKDATLNYAKKIDLNAATPSKVFPKPNFSSMEKAGVPHETLVKLKTYYTAFSITNNRKNKNGQNQKLLASKFYASIARDMLLRDVDVSNENVGGIVLTDYGKEHIGYLEKCIEALDKQVPEGFFDLDLSDVDFKIGAFKEYENGYYKTKDGRRWVGSSMTSTIPSGSSKFVSFKDNLFELDDIKGITDEYCKLVESSREKQVQDEIRFTVYRVRDTGKIYIAAKVKGIAGEIDIKDGFNTGKEAFDYIKENSDALRAEAKAKADEQKASRSGSERGVSNDDIERELRNVVGEDRIGKDYRRGKDVTAEEFRNQFGFRGVEFGNWATQKERQHHLNSCYDALMDLAELIGVTPKALSLGGKLGFAFGSRGHSGALAHYEPAKNVINLTKKRGAGCVAHEWFHALDTYFGGGTFKIDKNMATIGSKQDNMRDEIHALFMELNKALRESDMSKRSMMLDKGDKNYWGSTIEMAARAFEAYVDAKIIERGQRDQYLAAHIAAQNAKIEELAKYDPYPNAEENKTFGEIFDRLFDTIEEKTDDEGNQVLFDIRDKVGASKPKTAAERLASEATMTMMREALGDNVQVVTDDEARRMLGIDDGKEMMIDSNTRPTFYSNAERAVADAKMNNGTGEQWLNYLKNNGGLKAEEDKWMGLSEWLKEQTKSVSKNELLKFIDGNTIEISEVNYTDYGYYGRNEHGAKLFNWIDQNIETSKQLKWKSALFYTSYSDDKGYYFEDGVSRGDIIDDMLKRINNSIDTSKRTNEIRVRYTTEGLKNKREIALVVPSIEPYKADDGIHFGDAGKGRAVAWVRFGDAKHTIYEVTKPENKDIYYKALEECNDYISSLEDKYGLKDTNDLKLYEVMTREENEHIRELEKKIDDAESLVYQEKRERVLVIDEIQSKRHQDGRELGYYGNMADEEYDIIKKYIAAKDILNGEDVSRFRGRRLHDELAKREEAKQIIDDLVSKFGEQKLETIVTKFGNRNGVPDAPFQKNWHELAMKRMLRYAAENGYDRVAWTTGEQQGDRYDLGSRIESIKANKVTVDDLTGEPVDNGEYSVFAMESKYNPITSVSGRMDAEKIISIYGKDLGNRIISKADEGAGEQVEISGEGLRVGIEGMKAFYDRMLPQFMDKYGKKWGVKTEDVELDLPNKGDRVMHSVDVTDAMKESVMNGQPMFLRTSKGNVYGWTVDGKVYLTESGLNPNTKIHEYTHLWDKALQQTNPELWKKGVDLMKQTPVWEEVMKDENYSDIWGDEDKVASEVHSRLSGKEGAERLKEMAEEVLNSDADPLTKAKKLSVIEKLKNWLRKFWWWTKDTFTKWGAKDIEKVSLDDFVNMPLKDLAKGVNPTDAAKMSIEKMDKEYLDAVERGDMETAQRMVNEAADRILGATLLPDDTEEVGYKYHRGKAPTKIRKMFAVLNVNPDGFHAAYAGNKNPTPVGTFVDAQNLRSYESSSTFFDDGTPATYIPGDTGKSTKAAGIDPEERDPEAIGKSWLLERGGKHGSDVPNFSQMNLGVDENGNKITNKATDGALPHNKLVFEIECGMDEDGDLTEYVKENGRMMKGKNQGLKSIKPNQFYFFKTNPNAKGNWGIAGTFRIKRLVPYDEIVRVSKEAGVPVQKWVGGYHPEDSGLTVEMVDDMYEEGKKSKLMDAVTYDDEGNIIPLSKRFDMTKDDIRYSLTREKGTKQDKAITENPAVATGRVPKEITRADIDGGFTGSVDKYEDEALKGEHGMNALRIAAENRRYDSERPQFHIGLADPDDVPDESGIRTLNVVSGNAADNYNRALKTASYKWTEAWQDSMKSLQVLQDEIVKATGIEMKPNENTYWAENRMSSVNRAQMEVFSKKIFNPLLKAVNDFKKAGKDYFDVTDYMMAKHGLERNDVLAMRDAKRTADEKISQLTIDAKNKYKRDAGVEKANKSYKISQLEDRYSNGLIDDATLISETERINNEYKANVRRLKDVLNDEISNAEAKRPSIEKSEYTKNRENDYAGLTALTGTDNVTDAEDAATKMVDDFEGDVDAKLVTNLWDKVRVVTDSQLDNALDRGLITEKLYTELKGQYNNYIPLRGFEETTTDEVWDYVDTTRSPYSTPIRTAKGRKSKADDPIATLGNVSESGIMEGNRNVMKQHLLRFAENHPSDLITINEYWAKYDPASDSWETLMPEIPAGSTDSEIEKKWEEFEVKMKNLKEDYPDLYDKRRGISKFPYRMLKPFLKEHQVTVQRAGQTYVLTINGNPRAAQAINGKTNPEVVGDITQFMGYVNRFIASMATQKNPAFVLCNISRDFWYSNTMVWTKENPAYAVKFTNNCGIAITNLPKLISRYNKGTIDTSKYYDRMFNNFINNGGETGFTVLHSTKEYKSIVDDLMKQNERKSYNPITIYKYLNNGIDQFNRWAEDVARFAAYVTSIESGRSEEQAIWDAKQVSVNFNKKGAGSSVSGKLEKGNRLHYLTAHASQTARNAYVFFNPGVQGLDNFATIAKKNKGKMSASVVTWLALGLTAPIFSSILASLWGDDENKDDYWNLPDYVRRQNFCIRTPFGFIKLPIPIELRAIYGLGDIIYGLTSGNLNYTSMQAATEVAKQASQVMPIDMVGEGAGALWPSQIKPFAEAYVTNTDWTGMPIEKEDYGNSQPKYKRAFNSTSRTLVNACRTLNEWSGGNSGKKGYIDIDPAKVEHIFGGLLGGVGTIYNQTVRTVEQLTGDEDFEWRNAPVASRFFSEIDDRMPYMRIKNEWFNNKKTIDDFNTEIRVNEKDMFDTALSEEERVKAERIYNELIDSPMAWKREVWKEYQTEYNRLKKEFEETGDEEVEKEKYEIMQLMNDVMKAESIEDLN